MSCCLRTPIPVSEKKCKPMSENVNESGSKPAEAPKKQAPKKPEKVYKYGSKTAYEPFFGEDVSVETMSEHLSAATFMGDFWKNQRGVNGKLKYWYIECNHFPAVDKYLSDILDAAFKAAKTPREKTEVADTHPVQEMLIAKPGTDKMVLPFWYIKNSIKPPSEEEIIFNCAATIEHQVEPPGHWVADYQYIPTQIEPDERDLSSWMDAIFHPDPDKPCELDPLWLLGLHNKEKKLTSHGAKFAKKWNGPVPTIKGQPDEIRLFGHPVLELGECCASANSKAYEIINFYHKYCIKSPSVNRFGEWLSSLGAEPPSVDEPEGFQFHTPSTLKNFRLPWEHLRTLEETADYINQNTVDVIKELIKKHCGDVVLGDVEDALTHSESSLPAKQEKFDKWKLALKGFENIGFYIPESLEDVSDVAKQKVEKARAKREETITEELIESVDRLQFDLQQLIEAKKNKAPTIDGGLYGEKPAGSTVMTGKAGFNVRRVTTIDFMQWKTVHDRVEKVIQASVHAANPFSFRGQRPVVVRVGQAKHTHTSGQDRSLHVDDYAGYEIKAEKNEKVADIIEEFNKSLTNHLGPTPTILWGNITLTKEWVDFGNNWPLDELSPGQTYYIPDPRSLPAGDPPASQYPMTTD
jgi:hypothetical protein